MASKEVNKMLSEAIETVVALGIELVRLPKVSNNRGKEENV